MSSYEQHSLLSLLSCAFVLCWQACGARHAHDLTSVVRTLLLLLYPQEMNMAKTWRAFPDSSSKV